MPWRAMNALAKYFDASSCAAARRGPKMRSPASANVSTTPAASGASGPTTVRWMPSFFAKASSSGMAAMATFSRPFSTAVPPFPGATNTFCTRGLCASFHAIACSLPPPPMTRSFMSVPEVTRAGKHHHRTPLVGRGDHFGVSHASARLNHRHCTRFENDLDSIAEREEGIRSDYRAGERQAGGLRLHRRQARAVDAAHLAGADAEGHAVATEDDGVRFHELRHDPGEAQVGELRLAGLLLRHHFEVLQSFSIGALHQKPAADALVVVLLRIVRKRHFDEPEVVL